jgi:hypothetical protein
MAIGHIIFPATRPARKKGNGCAEEFRIRVSRFTAGNT